MWRAGGEEPGGERLGSRMFGRERSGQGEMRLMQARRWRAVGREVTGRRGRDALVQDARVSQPSRYTRLRTSIIRLTFRAVQVGRGGRSRRW